MVEVLRELISYFATSSGGSFQLYKFFSSKIFMGDCQGVEQLWKGVGYVNGVHGVKPKFLGTIHIIYFGNIVCKASLVFNS